jgi:hypothetical protein
MGKDSKRTKTGFRRKIAIVRSGLTGLSNSGQFDSPQRLNMLERISSVLLQQKKTNEASGYYKTIVKLQQAKLGETHPATIGAKQKLADIFVADGDMQNAASYLEQAVTASSKVTPPLPQKQQLNLLNCYSTVLRELGRNDEADAIDTRASAVRDKSAESKTNTASPAKDK